MKKINKIRGKRSGLSPKGQTDFYRIPMKRRNPYRQGKEEICVLSAGRHFEKICPQGIPVTKDGDVRGIHGELMAQGGFCAKLYHSRFGEVTA